MNLSQHKLEKRKCPGCGKAKAYPARNATCSPECALKLRRKTLAEAVQGVEIDVRGDAMSISVDQTDITTVEQLIERYQIDTRIWEVQRFTTSSREVKDGDRNSIRAWLKKRVWAEAILLEIEALKREAKKFAPKVKAIARKFKLTGNIAEIDMPDIHFGKLAWNRETGYADYDIDIAVKQFDEAWDAILARLSPYELDQIVLVVGNDLFHVDSRSNTTTAGTQVDTDSRYHRIFKIVRKLMIRKLEELRTIAPVHVVICPGNHDQHTSWHLGDSLECWFDGYEDVTIDNDPTPRKYFEYGVNMLMWSHGDKGKREDYPLLMATEQPEMFGRTLYREAHVGHLHTTRNQEFHGVRVRILPSLSGTDYWHSENGFTGNIKSAEAYVWNKEQGLVATVFYNIPEKRAAKPAGKVLPFRERKAA